MKRMSFSSAIAALAVAALVASPALAGSKSNVKAKLLSKVQTEAAELAALWVEYAVGDLDFDPTGEEGEVDCRRNQPSPKKVTILTGTWAGAGATVRECDVPKNVPLFFPVLNSYFYNGVTDVACSTDAECQVDYGSEATCNADNVCVEGFTVDEKTDTLDWINDLQCEMMVTLDGETIYPTPGGNPLLRAFSPTTEGFGDHQLVNYDPDIVASGHWALLQGLSKGDHSLHFEGGFAAPGGACGDWGSLDVTYELNVVPGRGKR